jgi:hypothetical protein
MELVSCYHSGAYNFEEPVTFFGKFVHLLSSDRPGYVVEGPGVRIPVVVQVFFLYPNRPDCQWGLASFIFFYGAKMVEA